MAGELFVTLRDEEPVGFGIMSKSALYEDVASIGMYTIERFRRRGRHGDNRDADRGVPPARAAPRGGVLVLQPPLASGRWSGQACTRRPAF